MTPLIMLDNLLTKASFTQLVEDLVRAEKMTYIEAILHLCAERDIDPGDVGKLVTSCIKSKLEVEGMAANLLPKSNSLSIFL